MPIPAALGSTCVATTGWPRLGRPSTVPVVTSSSRWTLTTLPRFQDLLGEIPARGPQRVACRARLFLYEVLRTGLVVLYGSIDMKPDPPFGDVTAPTGPYLITCTRQAWTRRPSARRPATSRSKTQKWVAPGSGPRLRKQLSVVPRPHA